LTEAWKSLGPSAGAVQEMLRHQNPKIRERGEEIIKEAVARVESAQPPVDLKKSADLDLTRSNIAENQAQLEGHKAKSRKDIAEAKKTEIETMSLRTPAESYDRAREALNTAASYPERYGKFAFERAVGPYIGRNLSGEDDKSWSINPVAWLGRGVGEAGSAMSHLTEGGAGPSEIQSMVGGLQSELGQMIRKANGMSAKEGDSNVELQNFLRMVGQLGTSTSVEDYQRRLMDVNQRFARMMNQEVRDLQPAAIRPDQRAETAVPLHQQGLEKLGMSSPEEGRVIVNKQTGERMILKDGKWQPL
jgi:hypothetical protein